MKKPFRNIESMDDLRELEDDIKNILSQLPLDGVLLGLRRKWSPAGWDKPLYAPHVIAMATRFALQFCIPAPQTIELRPLIPSLVDEILRYSSTFAHADPCTWKGALELSPISLFMRLVGNQFPYQMSPIGGWATAKLLYKDIPERLRARSDVPKFPLENAFTDLFGVSVEDFLSVGYLFFAHAFKHEQFGIARDWFDQLRRSGINLPSDGIVRKCIDYYVADQATHRQILLKNAQPDRCFAAFDFNSLFVFPGIRPWPTTSSSDAVADRFVTPLPHLIFHRMQYGIFQSLSAEHKGRFESYFGHVLETYVLELLSGMKGYDRLWSGTELRRIYSDKMGKSPDAALVCGKTLILFEVKIARIKRKVYATGSIDELRKNLRPVSEGATQLKEFSAAVQSRRQELEPFHRCKEIIKVVVTFEPAYLSNTLFFREVLDDDATGQNPLADVSIISSDELVRYQCFCATGAIDLASLFRMTRLKSSAQVEESLRRHLPFDFERSVLAPVERKFFDTAGVS